MMPNDNHENEGNKVTAFFLLMMMSVTTPFSAGVMIGWKEGRSVGLLTGLLLGSVVGVGNVAGFAMIGERLRRLFKPAEVETLFTFTLGWLIYLGLMAWIVGSSYLVVIIARFVIHLVVMKA